MSVDGKDIFGGNGNIEPNEQPFAKSSDQTPSVRELFGGGEDLHELLDGASPAPKHRGSSQKKASKAKKSSRPANSLLSMRSIASYVTLALLIATLGYVLFNPVNASETDKPTQRYQTQQIAPPQPVAQVNEAVETADEQAGPSAEDMAVADEYAAPVTWKIASDLFASKDYEQAYLAFDQLQKKLSLDGSQSDIFKDIISLQMALCLYHQNSNDNIAGLFTTALQSRSPAVKALANYYLGFIEFRKGQFLNARSRAYSALSLLESLKEHFPSNIKNDCYLLLANALTCKVMSLNNEDSSLPGQGWADTLGTYQLPEVDTETLKSFLDSKTKEFSQASMSPKVDQIKQIVSSVRYSVVAKESPFDEVLSKLASEADWEVIWENDSARLRQTPVDTYIVNASELMLAEFIAGSAGLIARIDENQVTIHDPSNYESLLAHKKLLISEAITVWRHFLNRFDNEPRFVNAHYALALLQNLAGEPHVAIGECKLIISQYSKSSLAPYALLTSSKLKTNMKDYVGARDDLSELVLQYPAAQVADQAYLYLAEATRESGLYDDAGRIYRKVFNLNLTDKARSIAANGAAVCSYETGNFKEAEKWFTVSLRLIDPDTQMDLHRMYYLLAKTKFTLGKYQQATEAFKQSIAGDLSKEDSTKIVLDWAATMTRQGDFTDALNMLENTPDNGLSQRQECDILMAKADLYCLIGLPQESINILRYRIAYLADAQLRSELMVKLGQSYLASGQLKRAKDEFMTALDGLSGKQALETNIRIAQANIDLAKYQESVDICMSLLSSPLPDDIRHNTLAVLGSAYKGQQEYEKAALAYAGIYDETGV